MFQREKRSDDTFPQRKLQDLQNVADDHVVVLATEHFWAIYVFAHCCRPHAVLSNAHMMLTVQAQCVCGFFFALFVRCALSVVFPETHISTFNSSLSRKHRDSRVTKALSLIKKLKWLHYKMLFPIMSCLVFVTVSHNPIKWTVEYDPINQVNSHICEKNGKIKVG